MQLQNIQSEFAEIMLFNDESSSLLKPVDNMSIYRHHVTANLVNTLLSIYPLIVQLVGEDFFRRIAHEYIEHYPSRSANLHDYGQYLSDFLAAFAPVNQLPYLPEVATFEWICHTLQFAADPIPFDLKTLQMISPDNYEQLHFILHPASHVIQFHYPILRIIALCKGEIDENIDMNEGSVNLLIIRRDLEMMLVPLMLADYSFLVAIQNGSSLANALENAIAIDENFNLEEKLPGWIHDKTIVDVIP